MKLKWIADWTWWLVMAVCLGTTGWMLVKLWQLYSIQVWLQSI